MRRRARAAPSRRRSRPPVRLRLRASASRPSGSASRCSATASRAAAPWRRAWDECRGRSSSGTAFVASPASRTRCARPGGSGRRQPDRGRRPAGRGPTRADRDPRRSGRCPQASDRGRRRSGRLGPGLVGAGEALQLRVDRHGIGNVSARLAFRGHRSPHAISPVASTSNQRRLVIAWSRTSSRVVPLSSAARSNRTAVTAASMSVSMPTAEVVSRARSRASS